MSKKLVALLLVLALLAGGAYLLLSRHGGAKKSLEALADSLSGDCALEVRYEVLSETDTVLSRYLRAGHMDYISQGGTTRVLFYAGNETRACAEAWTQDGEIVWDLGTSLRYLCTGSHAPDFAAGLLSKLDTGVTVSAGQMRRFCEVLYLRYPGGSLSYEIDRLRGGFVPQSAEKCKLPENTRLYGEIRDMQFYRLTTAGGDSFLVGAQKGNKTVYLQKNVAGMQLEMLITPNAELQNGELIPPDTEKAEKLITTLEEKKAELLSLLTLLKKGK